jgi:hypothetical protein
VTPSHNHWHVSHHVEADGSVEHRTYRQTRSVTTPKRRISMTTPPRRRHLASVQVARSGGADRSPHAKEDRRWPW